MPSRSSLLTRRTFTGLAGATLAAIARGNPLLGATVRLAQADETAPGPEIARPSVNGRLHVETGRLVDSQNTPVLLRGFSTHGLAWFPQYVNAECFAQLADWGANLARLALYTHETGGYCTDGDQDELRQLIDGGVTFASQADMYVIIDWHVLQECDPNIYLDQALEFWDTMSRSYADRDNVIYEICNEPNGDVGWDAVKAYAEAVLPVIRANDPHAVVLVGTPTWSQRPDLATADPLIDDNVMYTLHFYAATHKDDLRATLQTSVEAGTPVFVSEYGICDASGTGSLDIESANAWVALMDELNVSSACWSLSNKTESSAFIASACDKVSGFDDTDLTESGLWFKRLLSGTELEESESQHSPAVVTTTDTQQVVGSTNDTVDGLTCTAAMRQTWETGRKTSLLFDVSIENQTGHDVDSWSVELVFSEAFELVDSWNGMFQVDGVTLLITPASYNAGMGAGQSHTDIGFIIQGTDLLTLVEVRA